MKKIITSFAICLFFLMGCAPKEETKIVPNASLSVPFAVNKKLQINVLSYKFISLISDSNISPPPEGQKYIFLKVLWQNTAPNRGIPAFTAQKEIMSIEVSDPKSDKVIAIDGNSVYTSIEPFEEAKGKELSAGENTTVWVQGTIPKDLMPPFLITFKPQQGRDMILELK